MNYSTRDGVYALCSTQRQRFFEFPIPCRRVLRSCAQIFADCVDVLHETERRMQAIASFMHICLELDVPLPL